MNKTYILLLLSIVLFSCKKEKTEWDSDWTVPLINDTLSLQKFVNDSTLKVNGSNMYELNLHRTLMDIKLVDLVKIPDTLIKQNFHISVPSISVSPGFSFIDESQINQHVIGLKGMQLKTIRLKQGGINFKLLNPIGTLIYFTITLPGVTKNGVTLAKTFDAPSGTSSAPGVVEAFIDLSGYEIDLTGKTGGSFNILQSNMAVKTDPNGPTVTVKISDIIRVEAAMKNLKVDYARGYLGNQLLADNSIFTIDALTKLTGGSIDLPASSIKFTIENGLKIPAQAILTHLSNTNYNQNTVSLTNSRIGSPFNLDQATGTWDNFTPGKKTIDFTSQNSNIEAYLENLGAKNEIGYSIVLNPWGNVSGGWNEVFPNSKIKVSVDAAMPLTLGMTNLIAQDTFALNFSQDQNKSAIQSGKFVLDVKNAFPFNCSVTMNLLDESGALLYSLPGSRDITSSLLGEFKNNIQVSESSLFIQLDQAIINNIQNVRKIAVKVRVNTPDPVTGESTAVSIPDKAFVHLNLKAAFKFKAKV